MGVKGYYVLQKQGRPLLPAFLYLRGHLFLVPITDIKIRYQCMAHLTHKSGYQNLVERLNRYPQGAPPSETLFKILSVLFSEREAELVSRMPIKPFLLKDIATTWRMPEGEAGKILDRLAHRGMIVDMQREDGTQVFVLPPPMAGFIEFTLMRVRDDMDQKLLAGLYHQYLNVEEDFIRSLFSSGETRPGRVFVNESVLEPAYTMEVMDYERASHVIKSSPHIAIGMCYCRHKMQHLGQACSAEMDICMTFNGAAQSLIKHGIARQVDAVECTDLLQKAYAQNLVQFGDNIRGGVGFICNCCGCCCEALLAAKRFAVLNPIHTTNFLPAVGKNTCTGCGKCVEVCPVEALGLASADDSKKKKAKLNEKVCLGCGVCVRNCPVTCITLAQREERVITPVNSAHRAVVMAIERGKLQHLIFDNRALWNHRALAAIFGVILKLPPIKQIMASKQMKSQYLDRLLSKIRV